MQAILFPTTHNSDYLYGLASHIWMGDCLFPSAHNRRDAYALPAFDINGHWVYPSRYNTYLSPQLPVYVLEDEFLVSTGHGPEEPGLPLFEIRCMCLPQLEE